MLKMNEINLGTINRIFRVRQDKAERFRQGFPKQNKQTNKQKEKNQRATVQSLYPWPGAGQSCAQQPAPVWPGHCGLEVYTAEVAEVAVVWFSL